MSDVASNTELAPVHEMRLVISTDDFDTAIAFYRDALGLDQVAAYEQGAARVALLNAGKATIEIANRAHTDLVDELEVGRAVSDQYRLAFGVPDAAARTQRLIDAGASLLAAPVLTPWNSLNSRLESPDATQLTLFQDLGETEAWLGDAATS